MEEKIRAIKNTISFLKMQLSNTDYKVLKYVEGEITANEYAEIQSKRKEWRNKINELETTLKGLVANGN